MGLVQQLLHNWLTTRDSSGGVSGTFIARCTSQLWYSLGGVVSGGVVGLDLPWNLSFLLTYIIIYLDY